MILRAENYELAVEHTKKCSTVTCCTPFFGGSFWPLKKVDFKAVQHVNLTCNFLQNPMVARVPKEVQRATPLQHGSNTLQVQTATQRNVCLYKTLRCCNAML